MLPDQTFPPTQTGSLILVVNRDHIEPPLRRLGELPMWKGAQVVANYSPQIVALLSVDCGGGRLYVMGGSGLHFDETKNVFVPADQINLATVARIPVITRDHDVSAPPEVKIGVVFAALADAEMGGGIARWSDSVE